MSNDFVRNVAIENRKRLVAGLMEHAERQIAPHLDASVRSQVLAEYRVKVLASVGQYHDFVLDCLKASVSDGSIVNEAAIEMLREIHMQVVSHG